MPPKIYVPFLNIGSVPSAKALKKAPKTSISQPFSIPQSLKELCYWPNLNPIKHSWPFLH